MYLSLIGAILISFSAVFVNVANVPPTASGFYRMVFGGVILVAMVLARKGVAGLPLKRPLWPVICGVLFALDIWCWHSSVHELGPGLSTILANFQVFFVTGASVFLFAHRPGVRFVAGVVLAMAGLGLMFAPDWSQMGPDTRQGVYLGLGAAVFYAAYLLALKRTVADSGVEVDGLTAMTSMITGLALAGVMLVRSTSFVIPDAQSWGVLLGYGLCSQVLGWVFISRGMRKISAALVGLLLLLQPSLSYIWDMLFFARPLRTHEIVGAVVAVVAIGLGAYRRNGT